MRSKVRALPFTNPDNLEDRLFNQDWPEIFPHLKQKAGEHVENGEFGSYSDLVNIALIEFLNKLKKTDC